MGKNFWMAIVAWTACLVLRILGLAPHAPHPTTEANLTGMGILYPQPKTAGEQLAPPALSLSASSPRSSGHSEYSFSGG